jgi:LacI family repressor for deo operon, udp, cdd, tsx, nupC, and nupG
LADVAKLAGVSVATASRALSNPDLVAENTRDAVCRAAESVGYRINLVARSLRKQRSNTVMVLVPGIDNQFYPDIIRGMENAALDGGYAMILGLTGRAQKREKAYLDLLDTRRADGMLILDGSIGKLNRKDMRFGVPVVQVLETLDDSLTPSVTVDDRNIARMAVDHLVKFGHRRIAHIAGRDGSIVGSHRRIGFLDAMRGHGLVVREDHCLPGDYGYDGGRAAMDKLLDHPEPPTAVFCANDSSALGAMRACRHRGLSVPRDISIMGVDDISDAANSDPPLSTIAQPREAIGATAMEMLIGQIEKRKLQTHHAVIPVNLVQRQSTAPPRA